MQLIIFNVINLHNADFFYYFCVLKSNNAFYDTNLIIMKFKKLVSESLSIFDGDSFCVVKVKGVRVLRVYFTKSFVAGSVIEHLMSITGLYFIGVNIEDKYLLFSY